MAEAHPVEKEQVMAYLEGELAPAHATVVAAHMESCAECRMLASELRELSSQMLAWRVEPAPTSLVSSVMAAGQAVDNSQNHQTRLSTRPSVSHWARVFSNRGGLLAAGVAVCVVIVITVFSVLPYYKPAVLQPAEEVRSATPHALPMTAQLATREDDAKFPLETALLAQLADNAKVAGPMIARTASLNILVNDFEAARSSVDAITKAHQGYASTMNISTQKGQARSLSAVLAIPAAQYDATLSALRALGRVEHERQGSEDVTSQSVDLEAFLKNARETEQRLGDILRTRTGKLSDVLEVETEMARVRGDIEEMEAKQKLLSHRVAFASIELTLTEEYQAQLSDAPLSVRRQVLNSLVGGFHAAAEGLLSVCVFLMNILPSLLLCGLLLIWPGRWAWRRWRKAHGSVVADL